MSQTLDRGLQILELLGQRPRRVWEIAQELEVHDSTALRLLHTLRGRGFVHLESDGTYRLGGTMFRLANHALEGIDLRDVARPHMERLRERCGETVHLGILESRQVIYIQKVEAKHPVRMYSRIGAVAPLHCTGLAKSILMATDPETRSQLLEGYSFTPFTDRTLRSEEELIADLEKSVDRGFTRDDEEHETGIHCIAAPVLGADGLPAAAMSISVPLSRVPRSSLLELAPALTQTAQELSADLGYRPG